MKTIANEETAKATRRSRNRSVAEGLSYLRRWEASGLTAEAFSKLHPVNAESLYRWRMKEKSGKLKERLSSQQTFRELKIAQAPGAPPSPAPAMTLKTPALEISFSGIELDASLCAFMKALKKEVLGV